MKPNMLTAPKRTLGLPWHRVFRARRRLCAVFLALLIQSGPVRANFHHWQINEIYSNADGTVQFIELFCPANDENLLGGQRLVCSNEANTNTFIFPGNLSSVNTANKTLLLATAGFGALPGGVALDFTLPTNFLFLSNGTLNYANVDVLTYTNLPTDGVASLGRSGNTLINAPTNSPRNFLGQSGSIVPVRISKGLMAGTNFLVSFATASGKNYTVEFADALIAPSWQTVATVPGNGAIKTVTNTSLAPQRFYRLRVP